MASTTSFKQQCPSCEAMVPIRDPGLIGRKIDCPKCKYRFVVEKPKSKTNDDDEDSSSDTPAPTKKAKKPGAAAAAAARAPAKQGIKTGAPGKVKTTPTRRRDEDDEEDDRPRKKQGGASTTVIIGASLGGLAVLAVVVCILVMTLGGKGNNSSSSNSNNNSSNNQQPNNNPQPGPKPPPNFVPPPGGVFIADVTNLLPNDAEAVVNYQIDRLHDSGLGQSALSPGAFSEKAFRDTFSFPLYTADGKGVERVVTAISHTKNWIFSILHTQKGLTINKDNVIASLQLDGLDEVNGLKPYSVKRDFDGIGTLLIKANRPHPDLQMLFLDDHTLVFADPEPMQKFLSDVKQFNGHPEYKSQPTQPTPPANQNAGAGGMNNPNNPNPGWTGPQIGGGASAGAGAGAGPGGSGGPPNNPNSGMMNPNGGGTGPMGPGLQGGAGAGAGGSGGPPNNPNGGMMNPNGGGTGGPMGGAGQPPGNKPPSTAQLAGSYLTIEPAMKAMFDRIEKTDQPLLVSAVTSTKDPMVEQLGVLLRDRGASWATSKEIAVDEKTRMLLDLLKIYRPQDLPAVWVGFSLTDCASDKVTGVAAVDMGSQATAAKLSTALKDLVAHANAMLGGGSQTPAENGTNQGGMFPGGTFRPGGSGAGPGAGAPAPPPPPGMGMGPGSGAPPAPPPPPGGTGPGNNPNNPNGGGTFQPGGTFNPNGGNPNGGENNQGAPVLWLTQEGSLVLLNAAITFSSETAKNHMDEEIGLLVTRLKAGAESSSSRSRIHELAAALQRYVQAKGHFPRGTAKRNLAPERLVDWSADQRVSWMAELLPFLGDGEFASLPVDGTRGAWYDDSKDVQNLRYASFLIPQFLSHADPSAPALVRYPGVPLDVAVTNYVGVAGVGLDAANNAPGNAKNGVFGYERETKPDEVKDGLDKTIVLLQIPAGKTPWMAGGGSTVRGVSEGTDAVAPFVCATYQGKRGTFAVMGDFKVRFIPADIPQDKFLAMCTIAGGETIDDLDKLAPVVPEQKATAPVAAVSLDQPAPKGDAPAGWQMVNSPDGFSVLMPEGQVQKLSQPPQKTPAGDIPANVMMVISPKGGVFNVSAGDLSKLTLKPGDSDMLLDSVAPALTAALPPNSKVTGQGKSTLAGNPAREIVIDVAGQAAMKVRLAVIGSHMFVLTAVGPDQDMQTFFSSFKVTAANGPAAPPMQAAPDKPDAADSARKDMEKIQGSWKLVAAIDVGGKPVAPNEMPNIVLTIDGDKVTTAQDGKTTDIGTFRLDASKAPATFDSLGRDGQSHLGIYQIDGDDLKLAIGSTRPTDFGDKTAFISVLKRAKK